MKIIIVLTDKWIVFCVVYSFSIISTNKNVFYFNLFINRWKLNFSRVIVSRFNVSVSLLENLATHCIKWLPFRIHNETKYNNVILIKMKNVVIVNDVATKADLIKSKETETEKASVSMNVIADDEINLNKFKRKRSG